MDIEAAKDGIVAEIRNSLNLSLIGDHQKALSVLADKVKSAKHIRDTFFRMYPERFMFGHPEAGKLVCEAYKELAKKGCLVEQIISKHNIESMKEFAETLRTIPRYRIFELDCGNVPIPNVVIITYEYEAEREIFFGWNFTDTDSGLVFSSRAESTITYFDSWFEALRSGPNCKEFDLSEGFSPPKYIDRQTGLSAPLSSSTTKTASK